MQGPPSFQLRPKLILLKVLSSNYLLYELNATRFQKFLKIFSDIFVILVPLEILSHYPDVDISHWFRGHFQWIMDKVVREMLIV